MDSNRLMSAVGESDDRYAAETKIRVPDEMTPARGMPLLKVVNEGFLL